MKVPEKIIDNATVSELAELPTKIAEEVRRAVDSAYEDFTRRMRRAKYAAEDVISEGRQGIKRRPFTAVGSAAVAAMIIGFTVGWLIGSKSRD
jgi:ElaB/YqjD/DUF883 family membrane-anchored ribosome-binding protein